MLDTNTTKGRHMQQRTLGTQGLAAGSIGYGAMGTVDVDDVLALLDA
ncbi:hypothetical protein IAE22_35190, partial [Bacillus sp. S34]|nr:hypothetical protein [Bacillus sp. S34]